MAFFKGGCVSSVFSQRGFSTAHFSPVDTACGQVSAQSDEDHLFWAHLCSYWQLLHDLLQVWSRGRELHLQPLGSRREQWGSMGGLEKVEKR